MVKTWYNVKTFDDILGDNEIETIREIEKEAKTRCQYLKKDGKFFYYCGLNLISRINEAPHPMHPIYAAHLKCTELSAFCMSTPKTCYKLQKSGK